MDAGKYPHELRPSTFERHWSVKVPQLPEAQENLDLQPLKRIPPIKTLGGGCWGVALVVVREILSNIGSRRVYGSDDAEDLHVLAYLEDSMGFIVSWY